MILGFHNRLDLEALDFHQKVYEGYLEICDKYSERIVKIDASQNIEGVFNQVIEKIKEII